jgi:hypothetical protein
MTDTFQMGTTSSLTDLDSLFTNLDVPSDPDWSYKPFSAIVKLSSGKQQGNGFPVIKWRFNLISLANREVLRETYCPVPALSASVYIHTPINESSAGVLQWATFKCILNWPTEEEDIQVESDLGLVLTFTHCEVQ